MIMDKILSWTSSGNSKNYSMSMLEDWVQIFIGFLKNIHGECKVEGKDKSHGVGGKWYG